MIYIRYSVNVTCDFVVLSVHVISIACLFILGEGSSTVAHYEVSSMLFSDAVHCADHKAHWGNVIVILGYINITDLI